MYVLNIFTKKRRQATLQQTGSFLWPHPKFTGCPGTAGVPPRKPSRTWKKLPLREGLGFGV